MPEPDGYVLSKTDAELLKQMIAQFKNTPQNPRNRPHFEEPEESNDFYLARTPNSGIPALTRATDVGHHDLPGSALCNIYHLTTVTSVTAIYSIPNFQKRVWNISEFAIGGNKWIVVNRTRAGFWLAQAPITSTIIGETGTGASPTPLPPGTGVSPSSPCATDVGFGWLAGLIPNLDGIKLEVITSSGICTTVTVPQTLHMRWDSSRGKWVTRKWRDSSNDFVDDVMYYGGGVGTGPGEASPVVFWIDNGRPRLQIENITYDLVGPVCSSAGYATFVGGNNTSSATKPCHGRTLPSTCDNTFTIRLSCDCLSIRGWEGPGWYCVVNEPLPGTGSCTTRFSVVYLLDSDRCDVRIGICSGPYASQAAATAACSPPTVTVSCCPATPIPTRLYMHFSNGTSFFTCLNGVTIPLDNGLGYGCPALFSNCWSFDLHPSAGCCTLANIPGCGGRIQAYFMLACTPGSGWTVGISDPDPTCLGSCPLDRNFLFGGTPFTAATCSPFSVGFTGVFASSNFPDARSGTVDILVNTIP